MGYSISVTPTTPKRGKQALAFGLKHFRPFAALTKEEPFSDLCFMYGGLAYDHHPRHLGFDYPSGGENRELVWALTVWLAQRVGRKLNGRVNFLYDGIERMFVDSEKYDEDGWYTDSYIASLGSWFRRRELKVEGRLIKLELARLSKLWEEENR